MKLSKKQQDELDALMDAMPLTISENGRYAIIEDWGTDYNEDVCVEVFKEDSEITAEDLKNKLAEEIEAFDCDEYVKMYINSLGEKGVPDTVADLLKAADEHKSMLEKWLSCMVRILDHNN